MQRLARLLLGQLAFEDGDDAATRAWAEQALGSDEAASSALSHGSGWSYGGAYDSALPGENRNSTFAAPHTYDFQAGGN